MFTCLCNRTIHIGVAQSLKIDSFILSLRRFIGRWDNVCPMRSDNGTNFVGAINELRKAFQEIGHNQISHYLKTHGTDWITWITTHRRSLNDETLHTLLIEFKAIINSREMTTEIINDVQSHVPLSPSNLLTMKSKVVMPPSGRFGPADTYCYKRLNKIQHIVNKFWARLRKEFIQTLQDQKLCRRKWGNFQKGDAILLKTDSNRNHWPITRIIKTFPDKDGIVWTIKLRLGDVVGADQGKLVWPLTKSLLLVESDSPTESKECWEHWKITGNFWGNQMKRWHHYWTTKIINCDKRIVGAVIILDS